MSDGIAKETLDAIFADALDDEGRLQVIMATQIIEYGLKQAHAAGVAAERARVVALIEAEIAATSSGLAGRVRVGALEDLLDKVRQ